jgi:hypothetical protein
MNETSICPICNRVFPTAQIEIHANQCLDENSPLIPPNNPQSANSDVKVWFDIHSTAQVLRFLSQIYLHNFRMIDSFCFFMTNLP